MPLSDKVSKWLCDDDAWEGACSIIGGCLPQYLARTARHPSLRLSTDIQFVLCMHSRRERNGSVCPIFRIPPTDSSRAERAGLDLEAKAASRGRSVHSGMMVGMVVSDRPPFFYGYHSRECLTFEREFEFLFFARLPILPREFQENAPGARCTVHHEYGRMEGKEGSWSTVQCLI
jgi:hypothetical protein